MPVPKTARKRGEPPTTRQRESRRPLAARSLREAYSGAVGLDAGRNGVIHARLVESEARQLEHIRTQWRNRRDAKRALATLRAVLPDAVSGKVREQTVNLIEQLAGWLDEVRAPAWILTPEDRWLVDAQHELDDDEIAKLLSPATYRCDREAALRAVRERRRKIARRR